MQDGQNETAGVAGAGLSFKVDEHERTLIRSIVARAMRDPILRRELDFIAEGDGEARQTLTMDLTACHANGCPVDLARLLDADDVTFGHDITGIQRHIDRRTGKLRRAFGPRTMMTDDQRKERDRLRAKMHDDMKSLLDAAVQTGRASMALEAARDRKAADDRRRKARNARRRKGAKTNGRNARRRNRG